MDEQEAERFVKDLTHAMCCIAHRGTGDHYSKDMGEKVLSIKRNVMEELDDG